MGHYDPLYMYILSQKCDSVRILNNYIISDLQK